MLQWQEPPWQITIVKWLSGISPPVWGVLFLIILLIVFVRLKLIKVETYKSTGSREQLEQKSDKILPPLTERESE